MRYVGILYFCVVIMTGGYRGSLLQPLNSGSISYGLNNIMRFTHFNLKSGAIPIITRVLRLVERFFNNIVNIVHLQRKLGLKNKIT